MKSQTAGYPAAVCAGQAVCYRIFLRGGAVWLARQAHNLKVVGSNPSPAPIASNLLQFRFQYHLVLFVQYHLRTEVCVITHKPIRITDLDLSFSHKTCFENFNCQITYGSRIAIIGRNGSGKSTLLKTIASICGKDVVVGYVPQIVTDHTDLSGGQRFNKALTAALAVIQVFYFLMNQPIILIGVIDKA